MNRAVVQSNLPTDGTNITQGTSQWDSPENFLQAHGLCDGSDTYSHMEPDAVKISEQCIPTPTNPRSTKCTKYKLRYIPKSHWENDYI